jgi:hypothetical protein
MLAAPLRTTASIECYGGSFSHVEQPVQLNPVQLLHEVILRLARERDEVVEKMRILKTQARSFIEEGDLKQGQLLLEGLKDSEINFMPHGTIESKVAEALSMQMKLLTESAQRKTKMVQEQINNQPKTREPDQCIMESSKIVQKNILQPRDLNSLSTPQRQQRKPSVTPLHSSVGGSGKKPLQKRSNLSNSSSTFGVSTPQNAFRNRKDAQVGWSDDAAF